MNGCPKCGGTGTWLGNLGRLLWMRCRACGWTFTQTVNDEDDDYNTEE